MTADPEVPDAVVFHELQLADEGTGGATQESVKDSWHSNFTATGEKKQLFHDALAHKPRAAFGSAGTGEAGVGSRVPAEW
jgi:hypothetical protein